ncbi:YraN family protein [Paraglaciecola sp. L1A13]|uniref:YraN family protein n=1 Tax=Paraglaciecola sp. L1A13 TaxID=2686359 RepID=UPI00131BB3F3|nr:YraN family protein [Paraglaciecola sp. L1A13]
MPWNNPLRSLTKGALGEARALAYLKQQGLELITQNYRCRSGEIDIIMRDGQELVFVEVKYRSGQQFGNAVEFFHSHKRRKFESAIQHYMLDNQLNPSLIAHRIDIVGIDVLSNNSDRISWLKYV